MKKRSGQILILVLLVVVVALAVGLSVASRNISNLRTSTQTEQSQRAFSAAEGGVEDALSNLKNIQSDIAAGTKTLSDCDISGGEANCRPTIGSLEAQVNVKAIGIYEQVVDEGNVGQINLDGYSGGTVRIKWAKKDTEEATEPASVEITFICNSSTCLGESNPGASYSQHREAFYITSRSQETGFKGCGSLPQPPITGDGGDFVCQYISPTIAVADNVKVVRIRPFWKKTTVHVDNASGPALPVQTYDLTSTATTPAGITRKVKVTRTALPQLPAIFDYVLFSEGEIVK